MDLGHGDLPGRGFLTKSNREFLLSDPEEYSANERRQHRYQIRQNLRTALMDLRLLWELDDHDLIRALAPLAGPLGTTNIDYRAIEQDPELGNIDLGEIAEDESAVGRIMYDGLIDFLSLFAYLQGPMGYTELVNVGLLYGGLRNSLAMDANMGMYELELKEIDTDLETLSAK